MATDLDSIASELGGQKVPQSGDLDSIAAELGGKRIDAKPEVPPLLKRDPRTPLGQVLGGQYMPPVTDPLLKRITDPSQIPPQHEFDAATERAKQHIRDLASRQTMGGNYAPDAASERLTQEREAQADAPMIPFSRLAPEHPTTVLGGAGKGVAQFAEGMTTPSNVALGAALGPISKIPGAGAILSKAAGGIFSGQMLGHFVQQLPETWDKIEKGTPAEKAEAATTAAGSLFFGALAYKHAASEARASAPAETPSQAIPAGPKMESGPVMPKSAEESAGVFQSAPGPKALPQPKSAAESAAVFGAKEAPKSARDSAAVFKEHAPTYAELFEEAQRREADRARTTTKLPKASIPSEGTPEQVERVQDARNRLSAGLLKKPFKDLNNPDRLAIDQLVTEGWGGSELAADQKAPLPPALTGAEPTQSGSQETPAEPLSGARGTSYTSPEGGESQPDTPAQARASATEPGLPGPRETAPGTAQPEIVNRETTQSQSTPLDQIAADLGGKRVNLDSKGQKVLPKVGDEIEFTQHLGMLDRGAPQRGKVTSLRRDPTTGDTFPIVDLSGREWPVTTWGESGKLITPASRQPKTAPVRGKDTLIEIPGATKKYPARYAVRELEDVHASHNGLNFEPNPNYELQNDRDYKGNAHIASLVVDRSGEKFNPDFSTSDLTTAEHGPPILDQRGNVLGGNSRAQITQRIYNDNLPAVNAYKKAMAAKAEQFGISQAEVAKLKRPVLVRELTMDADSQKAITDFNKGAVARLNPDEQAVTDGRRLSKGTVKDLSARLSDLGEAGTMAEALRGDKGAEMLNALEKDGVITAQEKNGLVDDKDNLTPEVKARIGKALVGRLFENPAELGQTSPSMRGKLERIAPQVLRVEGRKGWDMTETVRDALRLHAESQRDKVSPTEAARQTLIGGGDRYSPDSIRVAEVLQESPKNAEYAFRRYANDEKLSQPGAQSSMFEPPKQREAFNDAFGEEEDVSSMHPEEKPVGMLEKLLRDESGSVRMLTRADVDKAIDKLRKSKVGVGVEAGISAAKPLGTRIKEEGGGTGRVLMAMIEKAGDIGDVETGKLLARIAQAKPSKLSKADRFAVLDAMEGRAPIPKDPRVRAAYQAFKDADTSVGTAATAMGVEIRTKNGRRPFAMMDNHFPHVLKPAADMKAGTPLRADIIENLVRQKIRPDKASAGKFVDEWVDYLESGKRQDSILKELVRNGSAPDEATAFARLQKYRTNIQRHGSLEFSRELNLPFYDPDPVRVMPFTLANAAKRLAQISTFGQDHQRINQEILNISRNGGDADFVRKSVDKMIGITREGDTAEVRLSRALRALSSLKMSLSAIPNATQSLNALVASDLPSFIAGVRAASTKKGRAFAVESGASVEPVLDEARKELGGGSIVERYLGDRVARNATSPGFWATEQFNRAVSANAGAVYAKSMFTKMKAGDKVSQTRLEGLGIDTAQAMKGKALSQDDLLMAAKKFSDATQFRTRAEDLPSLVTDSPMMKAAFQFKSFAYQQARFLSKQTIDEVRSGNYGRGVRNLVILGALYPGAGEAVRLLRNGITGRQREFDDNVTRYFEDIAEAGTAGILMDAVNATERDKWPEFIGGPAVGQATDFARMMKDLANGDKDSDEKLESVKKYALRRFGSVGNRLLEK